MKLVSKCSKTCKSPGTLQSADSVLFCLYNPKVSVDGEGSGTPPACSIYQTRVEESQQQMLANNVPKQPALVKFTDDGLSCKGRVRMNMGERVWETWFVSRMIIQVMKVDWIRRIDCSKRRGKGICELN